MAAGTLSEAPGERHGEDWRPDPERKAALLALAADIDVREEQTMAKCSVR